MVAISVSNLSTTKGYSPKDTSRNILSNKQFTVNIISEAWINNANVCAIDTPPNVSEWPISGLTKAASVGNLSLFLVWVLALIIHGTDSCEARSSKGECILHGVRGITHVEPLYISSISLTTPPPQLFHQHDIVHPDKDVTTTILILGLVKYIHVRKDVLNERGNVDPGKLKPVGRLGDILYGSLGGGYRIPRPVWNNENEKVRAAIQAKELANGQGSSL